MRCTDYNGVGVGADGSEEEGVTILVFLNLSLRERPILARCHIISLVKTWNA